MTDNRSQDFENSNSTALETTSTATGAAGQGAGGQGVADDTTSTVTGTAREAVRAVGGQATDRIRTFADDGKTRAVDALDGFAKLIDDAASQVDEKLGDQFGGYARQASGVVSDFSESLRNKEVDELVEDARAFVQRSPAVAIGIAAALGFAVARVLRSSTDRA